MKKQKVAILGASDNPERYSYKAFKMLLEHGHEVLLVSPKLAELEGHKVFANLSEVGSVDTLTMYVSEKISSSMIDEILSFKPGRVIFNPGSENQELMEKLKSKGVEVEPACTLVLLSTGQF